MTLARRAGRIVEIRDGKIVRDCPAAEAAQGRASNGRERIRPGPNGPDRTACVLRLSLIMFPA